MATWIFQTNPKEFDIDSQLMEENRILWSIRQPQYEGKVKPQDIVFLWRAVGGRPGTGGVIGRSIVIGDAPNVLSEEESKKYWKTDGWKKQYPLVELEVLEYRLDESEGYIGRDELKKHPNLHKLHILSTPRWTNYSLSQKQAFELEKLWAKKARARDEEAWLFVEGEAKYRLHLRRERNSELVRAAKARGLKADPSLPCRICGFSFVETYGELGQGFIEAHHIVPVADQEGVTEVKVDDLILVCSNCHRMLHRKRPWPSIETIKGLLNAEHSG